jgi:hypothetical protein
LYIQSINNKYSNKKRIYGSRLFAVLVNLINNKKEQVKNEINPGAFFNFITRVKARWDFVNRMAERLGMGSDFELSTLEDAFNEMFKTFEKYQQGDKLELNGEIKELRNQWEIMSDNLTELENALYNTERYKSDIESTLGEFDQIIHGIEESQNA